MPGRSNNKVPRVATVAINVKGADLLFLDHQDSTVRSEDQLMWQTVGVPLDKPAFGRVIYYVPLQDDGLNLRSLRSNINADQPGYSETKPFALGIQEIWPYLNMFFDQRSIPATQLLAEVYDHLEDKYPQGFSLAQVENLFRTEIKIPKKNREEGIWADVNTSTATAVFQRLKSLPAALQGLLDYNGKGFGLSDFDKNLRPFDMVVVDIEQIMSNSDDPELAEIATRIITAVVLKKLVNAMTRGNIGLDHVIVFADELNRLAPRNGDKGIGDLLAKIARETRDRGVILFGAGQFRSGINEDILKAAAVHFSMQTPQYELNDKLYSSLSPAFKDRLTKLRPGETMLQTQSLGSAVFAKFPKPFVLTGATWLDQFPPAELQPPEKAIHQRLLQLDKTQPLPFEVVHIFIQNLVRPENTSEAEQGKDLVQALRDVEAEWVKTTSDITPWKRFCTLVERKYTSKNPVPPSAPRPPGYATRNKDLW